MKKTKKNDIQKPVKEVKLLEPGHEEALLEASNDHGSDADSAPEPAKAPVVAPETDTPEVAKDGKKLTPFDKKEIELLSVSAVESMEVTEPVDAPASVDPDETVTIVRPPRAQPWWKKRAVLIPTGVIIGALLLFAIPMVRFAALGWFVNKEVVITVVDSRSGTEVSGATVSLSGRTVTTGSDGVAVFSAIPLGKKTATVTKKFYSAANQKVTVDVFGSTTSSVKLAAVGTITTLSIRDRLTDAPIAEAVLASAGSALGRSDKAGKVEAVIPNGKKEAAISVTVPGYDVLQATITAKTRVLQLIPSGSLYYMDRQDGKINVVKSGLDGSQRKVVVPGTGNESDRTTYFSVSKDWKYGMLRSKRAPNKPEALYVVTTKDDAFKVVDEGAMQFTPIGWSGRYFVYLSMRTGADQWRERTTQLKSYDAETGKLTVLDENASDLASTPNNALYEAISGYHLADTQVSYTKVWTALGDKSLSLDGKQSVINTVKPDGTERKSVKSFPAAEVTAMTAKPAQPGTVYYQVEKSGDDSKVSYGELTMGVYRDITDAASIDTRTHPAYLSSPDGNKTVWTEEAAESVTVYIGDKAAGGKKALREKSQYRLHAWLTNDRLIVVKDGELFITTLEQFSKGSEPLKVASYFKPTDKNGYGYGAQ